MASDFYSFSIVRLGRKTNIIRLAWLFSGVEGAADARQALGRTAGPRIDRFGHIGGLPTWNLWLESEFRDFEPEGTTCVSTSIGVTPQSAY
jgi:hypothetical protein